MWRMVQANFFFFFNVWAITGFRSRLLLEGIWFQIWGLFYYRLNWIYSIYGRLLLELLCPFDLLPSRKGESKAVTKLSNLSLVRAKAPCGVINHQSPIAIDFVKAPCHGPILLPFLVSRYILKQFTQEQNPINHNARQNKLFSKLFNLICMLSNKNSLSWTWKEITMLCQCYIS